MGNSPSTKSLTGRFYCVWGSHFDPLLGLNYFEDHSSTYNPATGWNTNLDPLGPEPYNGFLVYESEPAVIGDHALPGGEPGSFKPRIPNRRITASGSGIEKYGMPYQLAGPASNVYGRNGTDYGGYDIESESDYEDEDEEDGRDSKAPVSVSKAPVTDTRRGPGFKVDLPTPALQARGLWTEEARAAFRLGLRAAHTPGGLTGVRNAYSRAGTPMLQQTPGLVQTPRTPNYFPTVQSPVYGMYQNRPAGHSPYHWGAPAGRSATPWNAVGSFGVAPPQSKSNSSATTSTRDSQARPSVDRVASLRAQSTPSAGPSKLSQSEHSWIAPNGGPALHPYMLSRAAQHDAEDASHKAKEAAREGDESAGGREPTESSSP